MIVRFTHDYALMHTPTHPHTHTCTHTNRTNSDHPQSERMVCQNLYSPWYMGQMTLAFSKALLLVTECAQFYALSSFRFPVNPVTCNHANECLVYSLYSLRTRDLRLLFVSRLPQDCVVNTCDRSLLDCLKGSRDVRLRFAMIRSVTRSYHSMQSD